MQNDMRDRLIKLIEDSLPNDNHIYFTKDIETMADELIANGVIVPPCKVGDTVYTIFEGKIEALEISKATRKEFQGYVIEYYDAKNKTLVMPFDDCHIGMSVFLTKDQAEQKLKELRENG